MDTSKIKPTIVLEGMPSVLAAENTATENICVTVSTPYKDPSDVALIGQDMYVSDTANHIVRKVNLSTGCESIVAGVLNRQGDQDGVEADARFDSPHGITADDTFIYVADTGNNKIRKVDVKTGATSTLAGSGKVGCDNGRGIEATFNSPFGICVSGDWLYVADTFNYKIRQVNKHSGEVLPVAGSGSSGFSDGAVHKAAFHAPDDVATDGRLLFVADSFNNSVRQIDLLTQKVTTLSRSVFFPQGISSDGEHVFVTDTATNFIRKIHIASGAESTLATPSIPGLSGLYAQGDALFVTHVGSRTSHISTVDVLTGSVNDLVNSWQLACDGFPGLASSCPA